MEKKHLGKSIRKIVQVGESSGVIIPKEFLEARGLKRGDRVELLFNDVIRIKPVRAEEIERELAEAEL